MESEAILTASIAALVAFVGWIVVHLFSMHATKQNIKWQNAIAYRKAQLEELYGPIYSMLKTNEQIYAIWKRGDIKEINFDVKKNFESNNNEIRRILQQKAHLIDGNEIPQLFIDFMTSAMIWNWYCAKGDDAKLPDAVKALPETSDIIMDKFRVHIFEKTKILKLKLDELYKKNRIE